MEKLVPKKNYVLLLVIFIITILILCLFVSIFRRYNQISKSSVLLNVLAQIHYEELDHYILENSNFVLYIGSSDSNLSESFELEFKNYIVDKNLESSIIYISTDSKNDLIGELEVAKFSTELKEKNTQIKSIPNILIFKKGEVSDILYEFNKKINLEDVKSFLTENGITND